MGSFGNIFKTTILLALLTALLLWVGQAFGGVLGLAIAAVFVLLFNGLAFWFSDKIVLKMYKAQELEKSHFVTKTVSDLAVRMELPMPKVYMAPTQTPNAFATGRSPKHGVVCVTQGILGLLNERELRGVLAHEMGHIKNRDTLISTVAGMLAGVIGYLASMAQWAAIFGLGDRDRASFVEILVIAIVTPIVATLLRLAVSRSREYGADLTAAHVLQDSSGLRSALLKLEAGTKKNPLKYTGATSSTEHMFIVNPFSAKKAMELFSTHPSTENRVRRLENLKL